MATALAPRSLKQKPKASAEDQSDEDLIERFLRAEKSESEEAFRALIIRHGPMVLAVCRRVLELHQDAEDAFQATFLVLARRAATIRNRSVLAGWLYEVAHRIAVKARGETVRRRNLERKVEAMSPRTIVRNDTELAATVSELRPILHAEVDRLPERYRIPVILSYLEGKTNEEVAELLKWPVGTVKGRLSRARELLRARLTRRGLALSTALIVLMLSSETATAGTVPIELVEQTVRMVGRPMAGLCRASGKPLNFHAASGTGISPRVESLAAEEGLRRGLVWRGFAAMLLALFCAAICTAVLALMLNSAGFSALRSAAAGLIPFRASAAACH